MQRRCRKKNGQRAPAWIRVRSGCNGYITCLFVSQRGHGVDPDRAASRNAVRGRGNECEQCNDDYECERIARCDAKEQAGNPVASVMMTTAATAGFFASMRTAYLESASNDRILFSFRRFSVQLAIYCLSSAASQQHRARPAAGVVRAVKQDSLLLLTCLFVSQSDNRIDAHSTPRRNIGSEQGDRPKHRRNNDEREWIDRLHAKQQA